MYRGFEEKPKRFPIALTAGVAVLALLAASVGLGSFYTIDQGERGVVLQTGKVVATAEPGLHFKTPWLQSVVKISVKQRSVHWTKDASGDSSLAAYSQDQQPAEMDVSVTWHIPPSQVVDVYSEYGGPDAVVDRLIARRVPQSLKTVFGRFTAVSAIQDRAKFNAEVQSAIEADVKGPIQIDSVQVENIDFSDTYEKSVEAAMQARVEVQKLQQQQQQQEVQAKITIINAQAQADAKLAQAKADAQAVQIRGEAEAAAIKARGDALKDNPNLVELTAAERWDGRLPSSMIPGSSVPFISVK